MTGSQQEEGDSMRRLIVLIVGIVCAVGIGALVTAQDATPPAGPAATPCPSPEAGTPMAATPMASPEACPAPEGAGVTIRSSDIVFDPVELTIPAGQDVVFTLPNEGVLPHNFSIAELGIDIDIAPGETASVVVNAPAGTYEYFCNIPGHKEAGMVGTLTVE
jgi:plastocyanin